MIIRRQFFVTPGIFISLWRIRFYDSSVPLLDVQSLTVDLPTPEGWIRPVNDVSFTIAPGETLGIVGESGSGKTMLGLALVGLLPEDARRSGTAMLSHNGAGPQNLVALEGAALRHVRGGQIGFVFQEPMTALNPVLRVGFQIEEAIRAHCPSLSREEVRARTQAALEAAAVPEPKLRARQYPHELSGGLRQRIVIAIALAAGPRLLIADEPTTALDVTIQQQILDLLRSLRAARGLGMMFITHDLAVVAQIADRVAVMYAGRIVEHGPVADVLTRPLHPYTQGLLHAAPTLERKKLEPIPGTVPRLTALPPGCAFEPRCGLRRPECTAGVPEFRATDGVSNHSARCILVE